MGKRLAFGICGLVVLLAAWWILSMCLPQGFVPDPLSVVVRFIELLPTVLWQHALASLGRVGAALAVSLLSAVPAGVALGRVRRLDWLFSPVAYALYPVPKIALLPGGDAASWPGKRVEGRDRFYCPVLSGPDLQPGWSAGDIASVHPVPQVPRGQSSAGAPLRCVAGASSGTAFLPPRRNRHGACGLVFCRDFRDHARPGVVRHGKLDADVVRGHVCPGYCVWGLLAWDFSWQ